MFKLKESLTIKVPETMTGFALVRHIEDRLFDSHPEVGREFFVRAKETATHLNNENSSGWVGHNLDKVVALAREFGIEVEREKL